MLAATIVFAAMAVLVKIVSAEHAPFEIVFWRGAVGVAVISVWARWQAVPLATAHPRDHLWRAAVGTTAMVCWFYSLAHLPFATSMTLNYTSPIFIAAFLGFTVWRAGQPQAHRVWLYAAIAASFAGLLLILRPSFARDDELALVVGLLSGVLGATAYLQVRKLGQFGEPELRTVFYFSAGNVVVGAAGAAVQGWRVPDARSALLLVAIGVLASIGQLFMTRAFGKGRTLLAANLQYSGPIFALLIGWWIFGERIGAFEIAGIALVTASGIAATWVTATTPRPPSLPPPASRPHDPRMHR